MIAPPDQKINRGWVRPGSARGGRGEGEGGEEGRRGEGEKREPRMMMMVVMMAGRQGGGRGRRESRRKRGTRGFEAKEGSEGRREETDNKDVVTKTHSLTDLALAGTQGQSPWVLLDPSRSLCRGDDHVRKTEGERAIKSSRGSYSSLLSLS